MAPLMRSSRTENRRSRRSGAGFTILEVMVTVAILALIAAITMPTFSSLNHDRADAAAARVAGAVRFARDTATLTRRHIGVEFFPSTQSFKLFELDVSIDPAVKNFTIRDPLTKALYETRLEDFGATLGEVDFDGDLDLVFTPDGTPKIPGNLGWLQAQSSVEVKAGGIGRLVTLDAITGRVGIQSI